MKIRNLITLSVFLVIFLFVAMSCHAQEGGRLSTNKEIQTETGISFEDYVLAKKNLYGYNRNIYQRIFQERGGNDVYMEYMIDRYDAYLNMTEEEWETEYKRDALILMTAKDIGYDEKMLSEGGEAYLSEEYIANEKEHSDMNDATYYEAMLAAADKKGTSVGTYISEIIRPVYNLENARVFLENYFYNEIYQGDFKMGQDGMDINVQRGAVEFEQEFCKYTDELLKAEYGY